jgi:hypothetical protein
MSDSPDDRGDRMSPVLALGATLVTAAFVAWIVTAQSQQGRLYYEAPAASRTADLTARDASGGAGWSAPPPRPAVSSAEGN